MTTYFYDEAASRNGKGNLTKRTQQRGLSSSLVSTEVRYNYDAWNRPAGRAYTGDVNGVTTPSVEYRYDSHEVPVPGVTSYPKGRLTAVKSGGLEMAIDSIDAQGRPTRSRQVTDGTTYRFGDAGLPGYECLRQGALAKMRYPSGREVSYTHCDLGRPLAVNGALGAETKTYVQGVQYTAFWGGVGGAAEWDEFAGAFSVQPGAIATNRLGCKEVRQ